MMDSKNSGRVIVFVIGLLIFAGAAGMGWEKLQYGFNFIDEGYHMTESWRLASGDDFLKDKITGALFLYTLINKIIFQIHPNITLLEFRKLEYILTIFSLLVFGFAVFRAGRQYADLPFVFSLFAFTGLDPIGMMSNLNYQTYPHLFLTLYLSFLLFGLHAERPSVRKIFYLLSGFCLFGISLSLLHMGIIALSPVILFYLIRKFDPKSYSFSFRDLLYVLSPFILTWSIFIGVYNKPFLVNMLNFLQVVSTMPSHSASLASVNWEAIKYIGISAVFIGAFFLLQKKTIPVLFRITGCAVLSLFIYFVIRTSGFGFLSIAYCGSPFRIPMWFSSLLVAFSIMFWIYIPAKFFLKKELTRPDELAIVLMIPFSIFVLASGFFSSMGLISVSQGAIPAVAAVSLVYTGSRKEGGPDYLLNILIIVLLLVPFYYTTARFDWNFTYFDMPPREEDVQITSGFGKGIHTNRLYRKLYDWVAACGEKYSKPGDYAISYVVSPMVHMIIKRRPSLDDTYVTFGKPMSYYEKDIAKMKKDGRNPRITFVFEGMPLFLPSASKNTTHHWMPRQFEFLTSWDPISSYVKNHMKQVSEFSLPEGNTARCFIDNGEYRSMAAAELQKKIKLHPRDHLLHTKLGDVYEQQGDFARAEQEYQSSLSIKPDDFETLNRLSSLYIQEKKYDAAAALFAGPMLALRPGNAAICYNLSCLYSLQNKKEKAIKWLRRAIENGYSDWTHLKTDPDLENIRNSPYYRSIQNRK